MASVMEGLSYGAGDALIGLNPVDDSTESVKRILNKFEEFRSEWEIPTQTCVLAHVTTQMEAMRPRRANWLSLSIHRWFRKGNTAFGLNAEILAEAQDLALHSGQAAGPNVMYFETGQGSELS